jgi:hypothetical protein
LGAALLQVRLGLVIIRIPAKGGDFFAGLSRLNNL